MVESLISLKTGQIKKIHYKHAGYVHDETNLAAQFRLSHVVGQELRDKVGYTSGVEHVRERQIEYENVNRTEEFRVADEEN